MINNGETFGATLRRLMTARGLSLREVENQAKMAKSKIHRLMQCSDGSVRDEDAVTLDTILGGGTELAEAARRDRLATLSPGLRGPNRYTDLALAAAHAGIIVPRGVSAMNRREFIHTGAMAAAVSLELARHGLSEALAARSEASVEEWHEIVREHGFAYQSSAPHAMLEALSIDILALQYAVEEHRSGAAAQDLRRCGALLAALMAMTVANLGRLHEGRRWWRTARSLADRSQDPAARAWVRGREVVRSLYEQRPTGLIIALADAYLDELQDAPAPTKVELLGGRAQVLALAGRAEEAKAQLPAFLEICTSIPINMMKDGESVFGWSPDRQHFTESYVYSHTGDYECASSAQDAAISLYPPTYLRGPAQIELQRALCLQKIGDSRAATTHALSILQSLSTTEQIQPIVDLAQKVDAAIPADDYKIPEVTAYRDFLLSNQQIETIK